MKWLVHVITVAVWFIVMFLSLFAIGFITPIKRPFLCNDPALSLPVKPSIIGNKAVFGWALLFPPIAIFLGEVIYSLGKKMKIKTIFTRALCSMFSLMYYYLVDFACLHIIMAAAKVITGSYRPIFFELCKPDKLENCTANTWIIDYTCTNTSPYHRYYGMNTSFFSGHALLTSYAGVFVVFYLQFRFHSKQSKFTSFWLPFIQTIIISATFFGCISRVIDHHHHTIDVIVGTIVGILGSIHVWHSQYHRYKNSRVTDDHKNDESNVQFI
ncbi:phospholipid phosphatase 3-like [Chironomus tepperi]|uniref:phospholipid phosphatase 3-like n=1 Tax=Chironomus tepperi TaxID=113505 RepID=UPI00391F5D9D